MKRTLALIAHAALLATLAACGSDPAQTCDPSCGTGGGGSGGGGQGGQGGQSAWDEPVCDAIKGTNAITFTKDRGATLTPTSAVLQPVAYTKGLITLDVPNTLLAEHQGTILRSEDAGCTWSPVGSVEAFPLTLVAAPGGRAYGYAENTADIYRIEGDKIEKLLSPVSFVLGLGVDPNDADHLRIGGDDGKIWESKNAGQTFDPIGAPIPDLLLIYRYAFDPNDIDHILVGHMVKGASVSRDGGASWKSATGLGAHDNNVFSMVVSPADSEVVWAQGIDLDHSNDPTFEGRTIWRSTDGGLSFAPVVTQTAEILIRNGELLAAPPKDPGTLYFVFGTFAENYGTDIYHYDTTTGKVDKTHNDYNDISSLVFHPDNTEIIYLGLTNDKPPTP